MNSRLDIKKNGYVLFVINIIVLITLIFFRMIYHQLGFYSILLNIFLTINILLLIAGVVFNVLIIKDSNKYDVKKSIIIVIVLFIVYLLLNTVLIYFLNTQMGKGYSKINSTLSSYCESFGCDTYETVTKSGHEEFVINKTYSDYDGEINSLKITVKYNINSIISVTAVVSSRKEMFSPRIIRLELSDYFSNFNCSISEDKIKEAFDNRFTSPVVSDNVTYEVTEVYDDGNLESLRTTITLDF